MSNLCAVAAPADVLGNIPAHTDGMMPGHWGIAARSAVVAATVVLIALAAAGAGLIVLLYRIMITDVNDAATARLHDITASLRADPVDQIDAELLATDQRVVGIQVIDADGRVLKRSGDAPDQPMVALSRFGPHPTVGIPVDAVPDDDVRISGRQVTTHDGRFTILVAGGTESVESTVKTVGRLLLAAAPVVILVVAMVTYVLVKRSLRSVNAIRSRVAEISTSDLSERVPVPDGRDEISALATTMNEMLARLEVGHTVQRQFVGDASHELRSPLTTIISALEVTRAHPELLDQELAQTTLMPEAQRMRSLIEDLLLLARADERGLNLRHDAVDLEELVGAELARLKRETTVSVSSDVEPAQIVGDARALSRVLRNLTDNAVRHANSRVTIRVEARAGRAVLSVCDDGPGIAVTERTRVFDRFVRLDADRARSAGGTGLGLAIVAEIVAAHGGDITIEDASGGGTAMVVQFPLSSDSSR